MFTFIGKRLTYGNVAATIAIVFAMAGGAFAATGSHQLSTHGVAVARPAKKAPLVKITSLSQLSPSVRKALQGKAGPAGAPGATGAPGAAGEKGQNGSNGTTGSSGTNGKSAEVAEVAKGNAEHCEEQGGVEVKVTGGTPQYACSGKTGFTKTLPSGDSERGVWSIIYHATEANSPGSSPISFIVPVETAVTEQFVGLEEGEGEPKEKLPTGCAGNFQHPIAAKGNLCVFTGALSNAGPFFGGSFFTSPEAAANGKTGLGGTGVIVKSAEEGIVEAGGSWVLTAN